ncbi:sgt1 protein hsgt1 suppressor of gcr2 [Anaeramoeba flamelloides]|uniref:Sgt1 protein hsgt1 suppressor of gcr2 n=1 Tax=Anaeramoeba flamelloides TaxID=1746091 RepID=A0AAV7Y3F2_9EUKA|nr:sgt1 protein hsgt1 suppressor of gcr2 [Anaeramoeba flamelloides]
MSDNIVNIQFYPLNIPNTDQEKFFDKRLTNLQATLSKLMEGHLWSYEVPEIIHQKSSPYFTLSCNTSECVDDEWYVISLMFPLTSQHQDLCVSISDEDGEILLIEAANILPKWVNVETSADRCYLYQGEIHLIPPPRKPSDFLIIPVTPTIDDALRIFQKGQVDTLAPLKVRNHFKQKFENYKDRMRQFSSHHTSCYLTYEIAFLLESNPQLISEIIYWIYNADIEDYKITGKMAKFWVHSKSKSKLLMNNQKKNIRNVKMERDDLSWNKKDLVLYRVRFTRYLYALIKSIEYRFPYFMQIEKALLQIKDEKEKQRVLIGLKIICGFEIAYQRSKSHLQRIQNENWKTFKSGISNRGYFQNEREGSKIYKKLESKAKVAFLKDWKQRLEEEGKIKEFDNLFYKSIDKLLTKFPINYQQLFQNQKQNQNQNQNTNKVGDDDEEWMKLNDNDLEKMLATNWMEKAENENKSDIDDMVYRLNQFMESESDWRGVANETENKSNRDNAKTIQQRIEKENDKQIKNKKENDKQVENKKEIEKKTENKMDGVERKDNVKKNGRVSGDEQKGKGVKREEIVNEGMVELEKKKNYGIEDSGNEEITNFDFNFKKFLKIIRPKDQEEIEMEKVIKEMDLELKNNTTLGETFEYINEIDDDKEEEEEGKSENLQVDFNLVNNLLNSFDAQQGLSGPTSNLLNTLNIKLPPNND